MTETATLEPNLFRGKRDGSPRKKSRGKGYFTLLSLVILAFFVFKGVSTGVTKVSGEVHATREPEIQTLQEGFLKEIRVQNSKRVKQGDLLFTFENDRLELEHFNAIQQKENLGEEVRQLRKESRHFRKRAESARILFENGVVSRLALEEAKLEEARIKTRLHEKQRHLEETKVRADALQRENDSLRLTAPFDGIFLGDLAKRQGTYFKRGETLGILFDPKEFYLEVSVPEQKVTRVHVGDEARIYVKGFGGIFSATVDEIGEQAIETIEKVYKVKHIVKAKVSLERFPAGLRPGMRGVAKIFPRSTSKGAGKESLA